MRDQIVDIDSAFHVPIDNLRNVAPSARTAKGRALPGPARHQLKRPRRNLLPRARDSDNHAGAPSTLTALERLAHQLDVADALERKIRATARQVHDMRNQVALDLGRIHEMRETELLRYRLARRIKIDAHDHRGARHPRSLHDVEPDPAEPEHHHPIAGSYLRRVQHGADSGRDAASD